MSTSKVSELGAILGVLTWAMLMVTVLVATLMWSEDHPLALWVLVGITILLSFFHSILTRKERWGIMMDFLILNWDLVNRANAMAVVHLETRLIAQGAIPAGIRRTEAGVVYTVDRSRYPGTEERLVQILRGQGFRVAGWET